LVLIEKLETFEQPKKKMRIHTKLKKTKQNAFLLLKKNCPVSVVFQGTEYGHRKPDSPCIIMNAAGKDF
jgi:hypothetical protein